MSDNNVRPGVDLTFLDGKKVTIFPASLRQIRKLNKVLKDLNFEDDLDDETITKMIEAAQIVLEKVDADLAADPEEIEDTVDIVSFNKMIAAAMGADPNELGVT